MNLDHVHLAGPDVAALRRFVPVAFFDLAATMMADSVGGNRHETGEFTPQQSCPNAQHCS